MSRKAFIDSFHAHYKRLVGQPFGQQSNVYVERYAHGGMSSGMIGFNFWQNIGLPMLLERLEDANEERKAGDYDASN